MVYTCNLIKNGHTDKNYPHITDEETDAENFLFVLNAQVIKNKGTSQEKRNKKR